MPDNSVINISWPEYSAHIDANINNPDSINQMYSTMFCGKAAFTRMWIKDASDTYRRIMQDLYYHGRSVCNQSGDELVVSPEIIYALNNNLITPDPDQTWGNTKDELPPVPNLLFFLTLSHNFHDFLKHGPYNPVKHYENGPWAGATIDSEKRMLRTFGYTVDEVGDNLIGLTDHHYNKIKSAVDEGKHVLALINSYKASFHCDRPNANRPKPEIAELLIGTHWVALESLEEDSEQAKAKYWEYAGITTLSDGAFKKCAAGALIVSR
jgi:hypothetical protein